MQTPSWVMSLINFGVASFALLGAIYWLKASRIDLPQFDPVTKQPSTPVSMASINAAIVEGARLNCIAARLTAISAAFAGVSALLSK
jgi:hypothetical protein